MHIHVHVYYCYFNPSFALGISTSAQEETSILETGGPKDLATKVQHRQETKVRVCIVHCSLFSIYLSVHMRSSVNSHSCVMFIIIHVDIILPGKVAYWKYYVCQCICLSGEFCSCFDHAETLLEHCKDWRYIGMKMWYDIKNFQILGLLWLKKKIVCCCYSVVHPVLSV